MCIGSPWIFGSYLYTHSEAGVVRRMVRVFEAGGVRGWHDVWFEDRKPQVARKGLHADLTRMLRPERDSKYVAVVGRTSTGKSTALRKAILEIPQRPKGAVYLHVQESLYCFCADLEAAVGYERPVSWSKRVMRLFTGETREQEGRPPGEPEASWGTIRRAVVLARAALDPLDPLGIHLCPGFEHYVRHWGRSE